MIKTFETIWYELIKPGSNWDGFSIHDLADQLDTRAENPETIAQCLNAAFLILLAGKDHPDFDRAQRCLLDANESAEWAPVASFYLSGQSLIRQELDRASRADPDFAARLQKLAAWLQIPQNSKNASDLQEIIWTVFFPEGTDLRADPIKSIETLRKKRAITITGINTNPLQEPAREILFTSNILLTLPDNSSSLSQLPLTRNLSQKLQQVFREPQRFWYDHPIQIGVSPQNNELLYGLRGLAATLQFEKNHRGTPGHAKLTCILSVSVTHNGLHAIAREYIAEELSRSKSFDDLEIYVFTEDDTQLIIQNVLAPAAENYCGRKNGQELLRMFGVDGAYGRHYSFLKAIAAFWKIFLQPDVRATFKIDLDQVFPQKKLVEQTAASAFEHFTTPLWGARGVDFLQRPVELGMIAGALVNESDIDKSLFTPDVRFPDRPLTVDEYVFFSGLPQAVSTAAEMMTRYNSNQLDGNKTCIQRVHVTGGTNGVLIDSLRRHRPFTPSFMGRAEDQAYLFSAIHRPGEQLAYVHEDGLIMRHDKEAFAQEAIRSAEVGRTVGDYIRILYFSAYADALSKNIQEVKKIFDPFTGCFISKIPATVAHLRFALKSASLFNAKQMAKGLEMVSIGTRQIKNALAFTHGENSSLRKQYQEEKTGWNLYYDILEAAEHAIQKKDPFAMSLQEKARAIVKPCAVSGKN